MLLTELFDLNEEATTESVVAIIMGRFNPPHMGHRAAWQAASQYPTWYVGTNQSTIGPKDPLPFAVKIEAMKLIWPEVENHIVATSTWLTLASEVYEKHKPTTLVCCTDEEWVTKTIQQYNGKPGAHGFYEFEEIVQEPTPRLSSATALRDAVKNDDPQAFSQAAGVDADTPIMGTTFFNLVKEYLSQYFAPVKKSKKQKAEEPISEDGNIRLALSSEWLVTYRENGKLKQKLLRVHPSFDEERIRRQFGFNFVSAKPVKGEEYYAKKLELKNRRLA